MRDIFIIDGSIFIDALVPDGTNKELEDSARELINQLFKHKVAGNGVAFIPAEAYIKIITHFTKLGKPQAISLISNIVELDATTYKNGEKLSVPEAMETLAYQLTLTPCKVYLVTNDTNTYSRLLKSDRLFFVANSKDALGIITHPNFLTGQCTT